MTNITCIYIYHATSINEAMIRYWYLCISTNKCRDFIKDFNLKKKSKLFITMSRFIFRYIFSK